MYTFTGNILLENNPGIVEKKYIYVSTGDINICDLYKTKKYPIRHDHITPYLLIKIRISKKNILPNIQSGTEYKLTVKFLPYRFTKNNIVNSGFSCMLVSIQEHYII
jgi:hypothetical protein